VCPAGLLFVYTNTSGNLHDSVPLQKIIVILFFCAILILDPNKKEGIFYGDLNMTAIITSALPTPDRAEAFTFGILALDTERADPKEVQKWQIDAKKFGIKLFRDIGIETIPNLQETGRKKIFDACQALNAFAITEAPKNVGGISMFADFDDAEELLDLLELDQTFLEDF